MKIKKKKAAKKAAPRAAAPASAPHHKDPASVLKPDMIAYHFWREWPRAFERGDYDFLYAMIREQTPLHAQVGSIDEFREGCRRRTENVPGLRPGELRKIRLEGDDLAFIYRACGLDDRSGRDTLVERWRMRRDDAGWGFEEVISIERPRADVLEGIDTRWFS